MVSYLTTLFLGKTIYQYVVSILSPVSDNLVFSNKQKREKLSSKECAGFQGRSWNRLHTKRTHYRPSTAHGWTCMVGQRSDVNRQLTTPIRNTNTILSLVARNSVTEVS